MMKKFLVVILFFKISLSTLATNISYLDKIPRDPLEEITKSLDIITYNKAALTCKSLHKNLLFDKESYQCYIHSTIFSLLESLDIKELNEKITKLLDEFAPELIYIKQIDASIKHKQYWDTTDWCAKLETIKLKIEAISNKPQYIKALAKICSIETKAKILRRLIAEEKSDMLIILIKAGFDQSFHCKDHNFVGVTHWAIENKQHDVLLAILHALRGTTKEGYYQVEDLSNNRMRRSPIYLALKYNNSKAMAILIDKLPDGVFSMWISPEQIFKCKLDDEMKKVLISEKVLKKIKDGYTYYPDPDYIKLILDLKKYISSNI